MSDFLFYPRRRIAGIGENNEEKFEVSIVKKEKKRIHKITKNKKSFTSKKTKHENSK